MVGYPILALIAALSLLLAGLPAIAAEGDPGTAPVPSTAPLKESLGELSREIPGRMSIYDLQFGPGVFKDNEWKLLGDRRTFNAGLHKDRLTLIIRFSYFSSRSEIPLKFIIRLPDSRQYDETVNLVGRRGQYTYHFTIHSPANFLGSGSIYLYYGFSIVEVLDFTIVPGT
jgi:hypothetical protein